jgi:hypothetical protein
LIAGGNKLNLFATMGYSISVPDISRTMTCAGAWDSRSGSHYGNCVKNDRKIGGQGQAQKYAAGIAD